MNNNFDKYKFTNVFDTPSTSTNNNFMISETKQYTFGDTFKDHSHQNNGHMHHSNYETADYDNGQTHKSDTRTQDQVMSNLSFSIEDLLSKITKARQEYQVPQAKSPALKHSTSHHHHAPSSQHSHSMYPQHTSQNHHSVNNSFKISNHSVSTQTNSTNERTSDQYIEKYQTYMQKTKKRQSQPRTDPISSSERNVRVIMPQKHSYQYQHTQIRQQPVRYDNVDNSGSQWRTNEISSRFDQPIATQPVAEWGRNSSKKPSNNNFQYEKNAFTQPFNSQFTTNQWGRNSSKNQPKNQSNFLNTASSNPHIETEPISQWGRNSSRNAVKTQAIDSEWKNMASTTQVKKQPVFNQINFSSQDKSFAEPAVEWGRLSSRNQPRVEPVQQWGRLSSRNQSQTPIQPQTINEWKANSSKKSFQTQSASKQWEKSSSKNQYQDNLSSNTQFKVSGSSSQTQIKTFPQTKSEPIIHEWKSPQQTQSQPRRQIKNLLNPFQTSAFGNSFETQKRNEKKSIIIQDSSAFQSQPKAIPIQADKKVNSLFNCKNIRQIAASTIIDSPDKMKKTKMSPFLDIVKSDAIAQSIIENNEDDHQQFNVPLIKINNVVQNTQKSEIIADGPKLTIQDFHLGRQLGSGKFGDVYQAIHKKTGMLYAIKKIFKSTILEYNMIEQFTRQLKIHYSLNYPNIIKLYTHFDDQYHIFLVMEYGQGGMLMQKLKTGEKFGSIIIEQMLRAVDYLHNKKIAHRDIKPENIVLMFGDTAKLCDFGWSRVFDSDMKKTFCGTLDYVSPQMKDKGEYSLKIDIWSLGVLTFEILCGFAPFKDQITNWKKKGGNLNKAWNWNILYPPEVTSVAQSFMRNLLKQNPNERANIRFCLSHLFIRKYNQMNFDEEQEKRFKEISSILKD